MVRDGILGGATFSVIQILSQPSQALDILSQPSQAMVSLGSDKPKKRYVVGPKRKSVYSS